MGGATVNCPSRHMTLYRFHQIQIELLIGELYNQVRCDRHSRQLYGSVAGNSGDVFFATCFRQFMIFCAKFYFSAQMATVAIGNANPDRIYPYYSDISTTYHTLSKI